MITASKLAIGAIAFASMTAVGLTARRAFLGSAITLPPVTDSVVRPEDVARARARYANRSPLDVREIFVDLSGSYRREPSDCAQPLQCHGMLPTAIAMCEEGIADLRHADAPPGGSSISVVSLGAGSFHAKAYDRSVRIEYPVMPEPPEGWDQPEVNTSDSTTLELQQNWRIVWLAWRHAAEQRAVTYRKQLETICSALAEHPTEERSDVLSAIERLLRSVPTGDVRARISGYSDLEEALGRGKQHSASELAGWCASIGLTFPPHTTATLFVTTSAPTLKPIDDRWRPLFINCGAPTEAIRFIPLARRALDVATP